jgi:hypothetical protein
LDFAGVDGRLETFPRKERAFGKLVDVVTNLAIDRLPNGPHVVDDGNVQGVASEVAGHHAVVDENLGEGICRWRAGRRLYVEARARASLRRG